jgi:hypothetical protein
MAVALPPEAPGPAKSAAPKHAVSAPMPVLKPGQFVWMEDGELLFAHDPDQQWLANSRIFRWRAGLALRTGSARPAGGC